MYLLDTNIVIFAIDHRPGTLLEKINNNSEAGIHISSLTIAELEFGIVNSKRVDQNRIALIKFISIFNILNFTDKDAIPYGVLKTKLKRNGEMIGPIEMLLAAQAISNNFVIVTNNTGEFGRIDELVIEDWTQ